MTYTIRIRMNESEASLTVWDETRASLHDVYSTYRNQGWSTKVLERIMQIADDQRLTVFAVADPYGPSPRMELEDLISYYERFGFVRDPRQLGALTRLPKNV